MKRLGISVYPDKASITEWINYIEMAAKYGFTRIFSCLLSVDTNEKERIVKEFKEINDAANRLGMEVIVDVAPSVFKDLNISYDDLTFFKEIGASGFRLDMGFTGAEEALMTFNKEGLSVEINMSQDTHTIDTIMDYMPNVNKLLGCHNFYPHNYSALPEEFFMKTTNNFKKHCLRTAAFVSSQAATFGPWEIMEGLPTLEMLRNMRTVVQVKYFISLNGMIDDVIVSNCFASEEELKAIGQLNKEVLEFDVIPNANIPEIESKIMFDELHFKRGDVTEYLIRSTMPRIKYKGHSFDVFNPVDIKRGDIIIESSKYGHYAGEMQIALQDMPNNGKSNVVGRIVEDELFLLDRLKAWQKFKLVKR